MNDDDEMFITITAESFEAAVEKRDALIKDGYYQTGIIEFESDECGDEFWTVPMMKGSSNE